MNKKLINRMIFYSVIGLLLIIAIGIIDMTISLRKQKRNTVLWLYQNTDWKRLAKKEGDYTAFMYDVINRVSHYNTRYSMAKEERIKYTALNFKLAEAFVWGYFDVPIIHALETAMNPHIKQHEIYGEWGMGGFWYGTALAYYKIARDYMPARLWGYVKFTFEKPQDLLLIENALKMTYIWLWIERYNYDGVDLWAISCYKWGRFAAQYWRYGKNLYPLKFKIKTSLFGWREYNPRAYHFTWDKMKECFERGDLNYGIEIYKKYRKKQHKLKTEQIEFRRLLAIMRSQEKELESIRAFMKVIETKIANTEKLNKKEIRIMKQIAGESKKKGGLLKKIKKYCRERLNVKRK